MEAIPAFRALTRGATRLVVDPEFERAAIRVGLLEPGGAEEILRLAGGATGRGRIAILALPDRPERLALRPLRHGGVLGPLLRSVYAGTARPRRELEVTARLRAAGAPVPRPVLAVSHRVAGPLYRSVFGTVLEESARDAVAFLDARPARADLWLACAAAGTAVRRFHDAGGRHPDLHVKNLLVRERTSGLDVLVIDLDRAQAGAPPGPARRMTELMRLHRSLVKRDLLARVGSRGLARFFGAYTAGDRALRRAMRGRLRVELARTRIHALSWRGGG